MAKKTWFAMSKRPRQLFIVKKVYNQLLAAMMITKHGFEGTEKIIKGWVQNIVDKPYAKDKISIFAECPLILDHFN